MADINGDANINALVGTSGDDNISAFEGNDTVFGAAGNDNVYGGDGNDWLIGGEGIDILSGEAGDDLVSGIQGNDVLIGGSGNDLISGGPGQDTLIGEAGADAFVYGYPLDGLDTIIDFNILEGDKILIIAPAFGIGLGDNSSFSYDRNTGILSLNYNQLVKFSENLDFNLARDIVIISG